MAKVIPENVQRLITEYTQSQARLIDIIAKTEARGNSTRYRKQILASVNQELNTLNKFVAKWVANEIPGAYQAGIDQAYESYRKANIEVAVVAANQKVLRNLINNATGSLTDANQFVGRRVADDIRAAGIEAVAQKLSTGATVKETKAILLQKMSDKGIATIVNKNGKAMNLDAYASTIARTTTREATNKGAIQAVQDVGGDLVKISQHFSVCPICAAYEGRVYSISGSSKDYPSLDEAFSGGYSTIHPNCFIDPNVKILTRNGNVRIADIKPGDMVLTHTLEFKPVTYIMRDFRKANLVKIITNTGTLEVTENHPLMVNHNWTLAKLIVPGDYVKFYSHDSEWLYPKVLSVIKSRTAQKVIYYNFSVLDNESYVAEGFLVHNCTHVALPYFPELDDNAEQLKADSNKPFEVTAKDKASIAAYNKDQAIKAARRIDRNKWEADKLANVPGVAKTFSGYRAQQRAANK